MRNIAEFQLIGRVGQIKTVGTTLRVSICANYGKKDTNGDWQDVPYWNEITIFSDGLQRYVEKHVAQGDLVHARGRLRQTSYDKDGETVYSVTLSCTEFGRLATKADQRSNGNGENYAANSRTEDSGDIPF